MTSATDICPCCYSLTLTGRRHFQICEVCCWEDDGQDDADADQVLGGPNGDLSLTHGRANYATLRASDPRHSASVRRPTPAELTPRSPTVIQPPPGEPAAATYTFLNRNTGTPMTTVDILCPPDAPDSWRKRLAVLAARNAGKTSVGEGDALRFTDLHHADLRDVDLSCRPMDVDFSQASLDEADLSLAVLNNVWMIGTRLRGANMRGVLMYDAVLSYARLNGADLSRSRLIGSRFAYGVLREANLSWANAHKADFTEADLSGADLTFGSFEGACFDDAILTGATITGAYFNAATFKGTILKGLDLTTANFSGAIIDGAIITREDFPDAPVVPDIHKAIYAAASAPGALDMLTWHSCETTHCRAGWAVTLAGAAGAALEDRLGTPAAATLIYLASDPHLKRIPDFHASDEDALADMKRLALGEDAS
jgi:Cysteine-rich CPCC/Pentapeptide repeats (8 copies)